MPTPQPEYKFHPTRRWRIDYYFQQGGTRVGLELEGGIWSNGRHTRGSGFMGDMEKYNAMAADKIFLVRAPSTDIPSMTTIETLKQIFNSK